MPKTNNNAKTYINAEGKRVLRITEVINVLAKDSLITWANMLGFKHIKYRDEMERTANIGTMVHGLLEDFNNPHALALIDFEANGIYSYSDQIEASNAIKSFFSWYDAHQDIYDVVFREKELVGHDVGGTIDVGLRGIKDPSKIILGDYKTSGGIYMTMYLQLAGYVSLYEEINGPDTVEGVVIFQLDKKNGHKADAKFISRERMQSYIDAFRILLQTAQITKLLNQVYLDDTVNLEEWKTWKS